MLVCQSVPRTSVRSTQAKAENAQTALNAQPNVQPSLVAAPRPAAEKSAEATVAQDSVSLTADYHTEGKDNRECKAEKPVIGSEDSSSRSLEPQLTQDPVSACSPILSHAAQPMLHTNPQVFLSCPHTVLLVSITVLHNPYSTLFLLQPSCSSFVAF